MKKAARHLSEIGKRILFIGFSIQIILGVIWMCFNFTNSQKFTVSGGVLYQNLILKFETIFPALYLLQLGLALFAGYHFIHQLKWTGFGSRLSEIWGSLVLLTFPMAMQCHLAISPYSIVGSLCLLELTFVLKLVRDKACRTVWEVTKGGLCWLLLSLILPEYIILGGIPLLVGVLFSLRTLLHPVKKLGMVILLLAAFAGLVTGTTNLTDQEHPFRSKDIAYAVFSRTGWSFLMGDAAYWDQEVYQAVNYEVMQAYLRPGAMETELKPKLEEYFTEEDFISFCYERAKVNLSLHSKVIIRQMTWDGLGYSVTPLILPMQLKGKAYDSASGRNYEIMINHTPSLTKDYVAYSCWWFGCMLLIGLVCFITDCIHGVHRLKTRGTLSSIFVCAISLGVVTFFYTVWTVGMMDYKCTIVANQMWLLGTLSLFRKEA